jgi:hypothetical protein
MVSFPEIKTDPSPTPLGENVTTVTRIGGGFGSYANGSIAIPVTLKFDHSVDAPFFEEDSTLSISLLTDPPGSPVSTVGDVMLAGSAPFQGGVLGGSTGSITISGNITPRP